MTDKNKFTVSPEALIASYQKNMGAITTASKMAAEAFQTISQLQSRYMQESFDELGGVIKTLVTSPATERVNVSQHALQEGVSRAMSHGSTLAQMFTKVGTDMAQMFAQSAETTPANTAGSKDSSETEKKV